MERNKCLAVMVTKRKGKIGEGEIKPSLTQALTDEERNDKSSSRKTGFDGRRH